MYITTKYAGYNRHGEQSAAGRFLILMQPKDSPQYPAYSDKCGECGEVREVHERVLVGAVAEVSEKLHRVWLGLFKTRTVEDSESVKDACELILNAKREVEGCRYFRAASIQYPMRAIVRYVRMRQMGHWMMGAARIGSVRVGLSGSYGADGLPVTVEPGVYEQGVELPEELYRAWNEGGGWNGAGREAGRMREWALGLFGK